MKHIVESCPKGYLNKGPKESTELPKEAIEWLSELDLNLLLTIIIILLYVR